MTATAPFADRLVADIAATLPGSTAIFRRHNVDFCCGGKIPLAQSATEVGANLPDLVAELEALTPPAKEIPVEPDALIDLILERYHDTHRREMPELIQLAQRVERVHGAHPKAPNGLGELLTTMMPELLMHMQKEEQILFPMMKEGGHPMIGHPITMMRHEHDDHGEHLQHLLRLTDNLTIPAGACGSWRALYGGVEKLRTDLMEHIHLENNILFPHFGA